jgi:hypothetical protein
MVQVIKTIYEHGLTILQKYSVEKTDIIKQKWLGISLYKTEFAEFRAYTTQRVPEQGK